MSPLLSVQLMDMGFTREHCLDALLNTANLEQATDYILTHPPPAANDAPGLSMDMNLSEEDQMMRAIAMSLGENVLVSTEEVRGGGGLRGRVRQSYLPQHWAANKLFTTVVTMKVYIQSPNSSEK